MRWCARAEFLKRWRAAFLTLALAAACGSVLWPGSALAQGPQGGAAKAEPGNALALTLVVDYGDGVEKRWTALRWKEGMTVADALRQADAMPDPRGLTLRSRGSGERFFVEALDGLANEGGASGSRNWVYSINDVKGGVGAGVAPVRGGDTISWRFTTYQPEPDR